jgi:hypothetical protein
MENIEKTRIFQLQQEDRIIRGDKDLKGHITKYYKDFFTAPMSNPFSLDESRVEDIIQVLEEENNILTKPFVEEEVRAVVFQMEHNKVLGPDGFQPNLSNTQGYNQGGPNDLVYRVP